MLMSYSRFYLFASILLIFLLNNNQVKSENKIIESINLIQDTSQQDTLNSIATQISLNDKLLSANSKSSSISTKPQKTMKINTDLIVNGNIHSGKVNTEKLIVNSKGSINGILKANVIDTNTVITQTTLVNSLISPNGIIVIEGDVLITNGLDDDDEEEEEEKKSINIEGASFSIDNIKQFTITNHDDFDSNDSLKGWSTSKTNQCSKEGNVFLGGHCNLSYEEAKKMYELPEHDTLRITAAFHMFDDWKGENGYMKIDDEIAWSREGSNENNKGINYCGNESNDPAFNLGIDITIPHKNKEVLITFGSTLEQDPCNASFGVDDVILYVK